MWCIPSHMLHVHMRPSKHPQGWKLAQGSRAWPGTPEFPSCLDGRDCRDPVFRRRPLRLWGDHGGQGQEDLPTVLEAGGALGVEASGNF